MTANPAVAARTTRRPRHLPVITLTEPVLLDIVRAGVRRAGGDPSVLTTDRTNADTLLSALASGHEVVIALCRATASVAVVHTVSELGGRPIPVLSLRGGDLGPMVSPASLSLLADPGLQDLEIPVPAVHDDGMRRVLWDQLRGARAEDRHHLVEVDGRPALEELAEPGISGPADGWACLAAGAAGVLAGRLAASGRRWRAQLEA